MSIHAVFKILLLALITLPVVVFQPLLLLVHRGNFAYVIPKLWHKGVCAIFSIQVRIEGTAHTSSQVIYLSNHLSYLDIPVIGRFLTASFVAKADVRTWPVFGFLSTLQQTAFISRARQNAKQETRSLAHMIGEQGHNIIVFPEGTSTDGKSVRPFKSSLFSVAIEAQNPDLRVQPFTISMITTNKNPIETQSDRDLYAWHIAMDTPLPKHLWAFAKSKGAEITLTFHAPILARDYHDRKLLSKICYEKVLGGLQCATPAPNIAA